MSQQKAQLVSPIDTFTPPGINVTGVVTATSFVGSGGTVTGLASGSNLNVGVITATFYGDGSGLSGVAAAGYVGQTTAAQSGTTTIDLSAGNVIYFTQDTDTTVAFASTQAVQEVLFIRTKDDTTDARTITWPSSIIWNGGTEPTLVSSGGTNAQIFNLTTRDQGVTWYGYESMQNVITSGDASAGPYQLWVWGRDTSGMTGQNTDNVHRSSPIQIPGTTWTTFDHSNYLSAATKSDGTLWVWGNNSLGGIGNNDTVERSSPHQVPGTQWSTTKFQVSGGRAPMAIKTDGTLWVMGGENGLGEFGLNDLVQRSSPTQIPGTQWSKVSQSSQESLAIKTDGTLWAWGYNNYGQVGVNDAVHRSSPVQVPGTQWSHCFNGGLNTDNAYATKTDGTLWAWGQGGNGQLGENNKLDRSSPIQIPGTQWVLDSVSANDNTASALKTDGTLWVWGNNGNGEMLNDTVQRSSPHQIPGTQWQSAKMNMIANKTDGTLWAWGYATFGAIGNNNNIFYSSPVQIPGTQWSIADINRGDLMTGAFQPSS